MNAPERPGASGAYEPSNCIGLALVARMARAWQGLAVKRYEGSSPFASTEKRVLEGLDVPLLYTLLLERPIVGASKIAAGSPRFLSDFQCRPALNQVPTGQSPVASQGLRKCPRTHPGWSLPGQVDAD